MPLGLFRLRNVATANVVGILWAAAMFAWFFVSALYLQLVLGYSPLQVGLAFLPANLIMGAFSIGLSAKLVMRYGIRPPLVAGLSIAAVGLVLFARAPVSGNFIVDVLPSMILLGIGAGMAFNPVLLAAMSDVSPEQSGLASGVVNTAFMMGGALGLAVLASLAASRTDTLSASGDAQLVGAQRRLPRRVPRRRDFRGRGGVGRGGVLPDEAPDDRRGVGGRGGAGHRRLSAQLWVTVSLDMGLADFERVPLLFGPSPVHRLERLSEHLGGQVEIWAKREDCNSGLAYGGNKVRKLEYLAAEALAQGCDTLVSIGGVQSNHTRQVAAVAARVGLACVLVCEHWVDWPDVVYDKVGNILLSRLMGADVRLVAAGFDIGLRPSFDDALASVVSSGGTPYAIPAGASDHPLGGLGFARWAGEVADQEQELGVFFDTVVVCSVTGSTQAGMIAGFASQERQRDVLGIDGSATVEQTWQQIARIARSTAEAIGLDRPLRDDEIVLLDEWHAGTYGIPDAKTLAAIRLCAGLEGVLTDPVYEGKSMAALIDLIRSGRIEAGSRVLYAHLGGQPALNAYAGAF